MSTETALEIAATDLAARFVGRAYGAVRVRGSTGQVITDVNQHPGVELRLRLDDPDGPTWPPDDIADLRRDVRAEVRTFPDPFMVYLWFRPATTERLEPEAPDIEPG